MLVQRYLTSLLFVKILTFGRRVFSSNELNIMLRMIMQKLDSMIHGTHFDNKIILCRSLLPKLI